MNSLYTDSVPRAYRLGKRADGAARTRQRIVEAARRVLVRSDFRGLPLELVAELAGVTRLTVYNQLGGRTGLLAALVDDTVRRMQVREVIAALALPDPQRALFALVRETCRAWERERVVVQRLLALATIDSDAHEAIAHYESRRVHDIAVLVARLRTAKRLASNVTPDEATALLGALTSFAFVDQLGGDADAAICRLVAGLLREPSTKSR